MDIGELYGEYARRIERMLTRMLGSRADAADITHDAFLRAYVAELGDRTELSSALLTVTARRLALNEIRNRTRRATDAMGAGDEFGVPSREDPAAEAERRQVGASLEAAIAEMPPQCRKVFRMRKIDGYSHAQISDALGISTKTVERHLTKAIRICRERLRVDGHAPRAVLDVEGKA